MKKWIAVNLLLLAVAALIGWQLRASILRFNTENDVGKIVPVQDLKRKILVEKEKPVVQPAPTGPYNPADFAVIPEKNLFSDIRSKEPPVVPTAPPEPPPLAQKPVLVGITIIDTQRTASILEPGSVQGRGERTANRAQIKRIGDVYQGYTITEINGDNIVLTSGTRKEVIPLHEGSKRNTPGKTPIVATRVVAFGGGASGGGTVVGGSGGAGRVVSTPVGAAGAPATGQPVGIQPAVITGRGSQSGTTTTPQAKPAPSTTTPAPGTRTIRTPFGDIVRPAR